MVGECYKVVEMQKKRRAWIQSMEGRGEKGMKGEGRSMVVMVVMEGSVRCIRTMVDYLSCEHSQPS